MDVDLLQRQFERIGARMRLRWVESRPMRRRNGLSFRPSPGINPNQSDRESGTVRLNIVEDRLGEIFDIEVSRENSPDVEILHAVPQQRHLLLLSRSVTDEKHKFLCGHDERHWFVAAVPENRPASTVQTAMEALKPVEVTALQDRLQVRTKHRNRRRNEAFIRQGEWFFIPVSDLIVKPKLVLQNEPLRRGGGKPHMVEYLYRKGGETVYVCGQHPNGLTQTQFEELVFERPEARNWRWQTLRRNPTVYVNGRIRHADHATIELRGWHQVFMNTESQSVAMRNVAFLD